MLKTLAVQNYRSLHSLEIPLSRLTVISGANGSGKSNLYGALRLLVNAADGDVVAPLARLIGKATERSQIWIISHSRELVRRLEIVEGCTNHILEKSLGRTVVSGLAELDKPPWRWG